MDIPRRSCAAAAVWAYEACPHNPILSKVDSMMEDIKCTGHAGSDGGSQWKLVAGISCSAADYRRAQKSAASQFRAVRHFWRR